MSDVLNELTKSQDEFENSGFDNWDDYVHNIKKEQAFSKLDELGYFHSSGRDGWKKKNEHSKWLHEKESP